MQLKLVAVLAFFSGVVVCQPSFADCSDDSNACMMQCAVVGFGNIRDPNATNAMQDCLNRCSANFDACQARESSNNDANSSDGPDSSAGTADSGQDGGSADTGGSSGVDAQQIASTCKSVCRQEQQDCDGGSVSGCYRAAACQCKCFSDNAPSNPSRAEWDQCYRDNTARAEALRSNVPTFSFGRTPPSAPVVQAPPPPVNVPQHSCPGPGPCASAAR